MNTNVALSYIAMLSVAGFFLWLISSFVRTLRQQGKDQAGPLPNSSHQQDTDDQRTKVDWSIHIFLKPTDELPMPGKLIVINAAGAFLESSVELRAEQRFSMYIDVPGHDQVRVTVEVLWAKRVRGGGSGAQVRFIDMDQQKRGALLRLASEGG